MDKQMNLFDFCLLGIRALGRCLKALWNLFAAALRITYRKWWIVLIVVLVALAAANYYARTSNRMYKVDALVWLNGPSVEQAEQVFGNLEKALPQGVSGTQNIAALLNISSEEASHLDRFKSFHVIDCLADSVADYVDFKGKASRTDTVNIHMPNRLCLSFRTTDPQNAANIGNAIVGYMNNIPQMQRAFEAKRQVLDRELQFVKSHIEKLDSLTTSFYFEQGFGPQAQAKFWETGMVIGRREIKLFTDDIYAEFHHYMNLNHELAFCTAPVVLEDTFTINPIAVNGRIKMNCLGLLLGWILGCLIAALIEQRKAISSWLRK